MNTEVKMNTESFQRLSELLAADDEADLLGCVRHVERLERYRHQALAETIAGDPVGRGARVTQEGRVDRQKTVFLPLIVRWAQHHYMSRSAGDVV